jgi:putative hemolysin
MVVLEIAVVLALFVVNGLFAMAELAIISSRRAHLERLKKEGKPGAKLALELASEPGRMLAAVQVGFTTTATLAGIFSGATLAERLGDALIVIPALVDYGRPISIVAVTVAVTYVALVIGELAPKQIALRNPEAIAIRVAQPLASVAKAAAPIIWILNKSTKFALWALRVRPRPSCAVTEEDIHYLVAEGARLGAIHAVERDMIEGVLDLADNPVRSIMTPRPRVQWVDIEEPAERMLSRVRSCPHAQLLACRGSIDDVVGIVRKQDILDQVLNGQQANVEKAARPPLTVHESTTILRTLELFRETPVHAAIVVDEFGAIQGIVTRTDLLETVAGDLPKIDAPVRPKVTQREDGSYLIDASVPFSEVMHLIGAQEPAPAGDYVTLAGFVLWNLQVLPNPGDHLTWAGWRFEVVDMDGRRIDMILAQRASEASAVSAGRSRADRTQI